MAWYRVTQPVRQTSIVEMGIGITPVCLHLKQWGIEINSISVRTNKLAFDTSAPIPADQLAHLDLEAG